MTSWELRIEIPGDPLGWMRGVPVGKGKVMVDRAMKAKAKEIGFLCKEKLQGKDPYLGAVSIQIRSYMSTPKSVNDNRQRANMARIGELRPVKKPDIDNISKTILDAMNKIVYLDDVQVVSLSVEKLYGAEPRTEVTVIPWRAN